MMSWPQGEMIRDFAVDTEPVLSQVRQSQLFIIRDWDCCALVVSRASSLICLVGGHSSVRGGPVLTALYTVPGGSSLQYLREGGE
jgi:hypothetical protein